MPILSFLIGSRKLWMALGLIIALGGIYWYIKREGYLECQNEIIVKEVRLYEERAKLEKEIVTLPKPDLVRRACEWVRDASKDECIKAYLRE